MHCEVGLERGGERRPPGRVGRQTAAVLGHDARGHYDGAGSEVRIETAGEPPRDERPGPRTNRRARGARGPFGAGTALVHPQPAVGVRETRALDAERVDDGDRRDPW